MSRRRSAESETATYVLRERAIAVGRVGVVAGPQTGEVHELDRAVVRIGADDRADLVLRDRAVSRLHCQLTVEEGRVRLRDLGSKNGTWLAGSRIYDVALAPGTRIRVGASVLEIGLAERTVIRPVWQGPDRLGEMVGRTPVAHELFAKIAKLAEGNETVLLRGESGTGKELAARALHTEGSRKRGPFVVVDGSALGESLADLELFGCVRGAFTDAIADREGAFERADGGTLFIDEVGELPLGTQGKLLRAIEDRSVQRLGDSRRRSFDARIVCATHRPLEQMVNEGAFRADLYHRIAVVEIVVAPLRDRLPDVPLIARHLLDLIAPGDLAAVENLERALATRAGARWRGNVRELRNFVRRVAALGDADLGERRLADLGEVRTDLPLADAAAAYERAYLVRLLVETAGDHDEAARRAGLTRAKLDALLARRGISSS